MPDFAAIAPTSRRVTRTAVVGFVDITGNTRNSRLINIGSGITDAEINDWRAALGAASNAGVYFDEKIVTQRQEPKDSRAFTDPNSSVTTLGVIVFDHPNPQVEEQRLEIPAIHISLINAEGTLKLDDPIIQNIINETLPLLNDSNPFTGDWFVSHTLTSDRKGGKVKIKQGQIPAIQDPWGTPDPQP